MALAMKDNGIPGTHFHDFTLIHHHDFGPQLDGFLDVVGDKDDGFIEGLINPNNLILKHPPFNLVHRAQRLVH